MRDALCKDEVLRKKIDFNNEVIPEDKEELEQLLNDIKEGIQRYPRKTEEIIDDIKVGLFRSYYEIIRAKFSLGLDCESLEQDYLDMLEYVSDIGCEKIGYVHFIQVFSLGILLEVSDSELEKLVKIADEEKLDDCLFDFLVQACGLTRGFSSECYQKENPYKETAQIIKLSFGDKKAADKALKTYMEKKWFQGHYDYEWKNAHKRAGYVGFWSFETGALAKILELDDEKLQKCNHYPYDLVHYKCGKKFSARNSIAVESIQDDYIECGTNKELEQIIPNIFRNLVNQIIIDYKGLDDLAFWDKYELGDIWYIAEEFVSANKNKQLLGSILVNVLAEKGYILQLDYKEDIQDYIAGIKNYWSNVPTKVVRFELDNDQSYYTVVPQEVCVDCIYEVRIMDV